MVLSTMATIMFVANLSFAPFFFTNGPFFLPTTDLVTAMALSAALALAAGQAVSKRYALDSFGSRVWPRVLATVALALIAGTGLFCLFFSPTISELAYVPGSLVELAGLALYAFALPEGERDFRGGTGALLAVVAGACSAYFLAATSLVATDGLGLAFLRLLPAGCLAVILRRRESDETLLLTFAGALVGVETAETLGIRTDLSIAFYVGLAVSCAVLTALGCSLSGCEEGKEGTTADNPKDTNSTLSQEAMKSLGLSDGEKLAVELTFAGLTSAQAAAKMGVKAPTVRSYLQRSYKKAGVASFDELRALLTVASPGGSLDKQPGSALRPSYSLVAIILLLSLVCFLPVGDYGLPAATVYAWVPIGLFTWAVLRPASTKATSLIGAASSLMLGLSFLVAVLEPEMGWTPGWSMAVGVFSAGLAFWAAVFLAGWAQAARGRGEGRGVEALVALTLAVAVVVVSCHSPLLRALFVCALAIVCFFVAPRGAQSPCRETKGGVFRRRGFAQFAAAFYIGTIACDANMGYGLYFNYVLAAACVLFLALAQGLKLYRGLGASWKKAAGVALVLGGAVVALRAACLSALLAAVLAGAVFSRHQEDRCEDIRSDAIAFSCGVVACLCFGKFEFSLPMVTEVDFRGVLSLTVFKTLLFGAGAIIDGVALLLVAVWEDRAVEDTTPYDARVIQYLQARGLSQLEAQILLGVARGDHAAVIARDNCCALGTVNSARHKAYGMLGIHSKDELAELLRKDLRTSA